MEIFAYSSWFLSIWLCVLKADFHKKPTGTYLHSGLRLPVEKKVGWRKLRQEIYSTDLLYAVSLLAGYISLIWIPSLAKQSSCSYLFFPLDHSSFAVLPTITTVRILHYFLLVSLTWPQFQDSLFINLSPAIEFGTMANL